jgi:hypothetical protein
VVGVADCAELEAIAGLEVGTATRLGVGVAVPVVEALAPLYAGRGLGGILPTYAHCPGVAKCQYRNVGNIFLKRTNQCFCQMGWEAAYCVTQRKKRSLYLRGMSSGTRIHEYVHLQLEEYSFRNK